MIIGDRWTKTWTFFKNDWHEGDIGIKGPRTHAAWRRSIVFDGARAFEGVSPDLELHYARVNDSAKKLFLKATVSTETWIKLAHLPFGPLIFQGSRVVPGVRPFFSRRFGGQGLA